MAWRTNFSVSQIRIMACASSPVSERRWWKAQMLIDASNRGRTTAVFRRRQYAPCKSQAAQRDSLRLNPHGESNC